METRRGIGEGEKKIEKYIYSMNELLGKGSYASVFRGRAVGEELTVAVKVIDKRIFANQYNIKNIHHEIEIMKKMQHENIVRLLDVYQTTNNMYIVTEYCPGGDLRGYLKQNKPLTEENSVEFLRDIMNGFKYMHQRDIMHRDLKPANILLSGGQLKISDFGFARNLEQGESTILNSIVGTPLYMSPQILNHHSYTNKSDLWSVGLIFYQMLHGHTPWPASSEMQLISAIKNKRPPINTQLSERTRDFILGCLQKREDDRMSWEEAFSHPLITEGIGAMSSKQNRTPRKLFSELKERRRSRSRSISATKKASVMTNTGITRTPRSRTPLRNVTMVVTPQQRKSPWRG